METVYYQNKELKFNTPNETCLWRAKTLLTKQPWTIKWINSFNDGDIFLDVGSNIGIYSIYASKIKNTKTFSVEPDHRNYYQLIENIQLNKMENKIVPLNFSISNKNCYAHVYRTRNVEIGDSSTLDVENKTKLSSIFTLCFSLDYLFNKKIIPIVNHIKIDTDGSDLNVLLGLKNTLINGLIESISIELSPGQQQKAKALLYEYGYFEEDYNQDDFYGTKDYFFRRKQ